MRLQERVVTAGAYVWVDGCFPFVVGPTPTGDRLGIVRLGGHREPGETPWATTVRELAEEASLEIEALPVPATYWAPVEPGKPALRTMPWQRSADGAPPPLVVIPRRQSDALTMMYLARASGTPRPAGEVKGLLLLRPPEIIRLARERMTLTQFRAAGGQVRLATELDEDLPLEPFLQFRLLAALLDRHPHLGA